MKRALFHREWRNGLAGMASCGRFILRALRGRCLPVRREGIHSFRSSICPSPAVGSERCKTAGSDWLLDRMVFHTSNRCGSFVRCVFSGEIARRVSDLRQRCHRRSDSDWIESSNSVPFRFFQTLSCRLDQGVSPWRVAIQLND